MVWRGGVRRLKILFLIFLIFLVGSASQHQAGGGATPGGSGRHTHNSSKRRKSSNEAIVPLKKVNTLVLPVEPLSDFNIFYHWDHIISPPKFFFFTKLSKCLDLKIMPKIYFEILFFFTIV